MLRFVLYQMDAAKRYLMDGSLPALRIALILLDNVAELILDNWIAREIAWDDLETLAQEKFDDLLVITQFERPANETNETAETSGVLTPPDRNEALKFSSLSEEAETLRNTRVLTRRERRNVARYFHCKVWYVTDIKHALPRLIGEVLSHLHRYRNAAHHSARVRPETIKISVTIFFEICCQLLTTLKPRSIPISDSDFSSWLKKRFGLSSPLELADDQVFATVLADLRRGLPIGDISVRDTLAEHLTYRIEDVIDGLNYIAGTFRTDCATALKTAQEFTLQLLQEEPPYENTPRDLDQPVSLEQLEELRETAERIRRADDYVTAFETYASADIALERIEYMITQIVWDIDRWTDMHVEGLRIIVRDDGPQPASESDHQ